MKKHVLFVLMAAFVVVVAFSFALAGSRSTAWLGVSTQEVDEDLAKTFSLPTERGAIINEVVDDSPAERAGLKEDDIIISYDGKVVRDDDDLTDLVSDSRPGDTVSLTIIRDGKEQQIKAELGRRPRSHGWYGNLDHFEAPRAPRMPKMPALPSPVVPDYYTYSSGDDRPYIGVSLLEISRKTAESLGSDRSGVLIDDVEKGSPAEKAGLQAGDLIVAMDSEEIFDAEDVREIVADKDEGDTVRIAYLRNRQKSTVDVTLAFDEDGRSFGRSGVYRMPDLPDIDILTPKLKGLHYGRSWDSDRFDSEEFQDEMKGLQDELKKLKIELQELKKSLH
ncbi:MAG: PDZ domain-containing protein [candidate division Zixibacteria bacterium]|nr:PDZ domain-containing protein [candidate division Zixibacteria bacterium]